MNIWALNIVAELMVEDTLYAPFLCRKERRMPKVEAFEIYCKEYDAWFVKNDVTYVSELRAIKSLLPEHISRVEIGVGTGRFGVHLGVGFGIDPSHEMS